MDQPELNSVFSVHSATKLIDEHRSANKFYTVLISNLQPEYKKHIPTIFDPALTVFLSWLCSKYGITETRPEEQLTKLRQYADRYFRLGTVQILFYTFINNYWGINYIPNLATTFEPNLKSLLSILQQGDPTITAEELEKIMSQAISTRTDDYFQQASAHLEMVAEHVKHIHYAKRYETRQYAKKFWLGLVSHLEKQEDPFSLNDLREALLTEFIVAINPINDLTTNKYNSHGLINNLLEVFVTDLKGRFSQIWTNLERRVNSNETDHAIALGHEVNALIELKNELELLRNQIKTAPFGLAVSPTLEEYLEYCSVNSGKFTKFRTTDLPHKCTGEVAVKKIYTYLWQNFKYDEDTDLFVRLPQRRLIVEKTTETES